MDSDDNAGAGDYQRTATDTFATDASWASRTGQVSGFEPPDPEARIPDVPAFRHVMISEPGLGMLYIAPHLPDLHPLEECAAIAEAFATFIDEPESPSTSLIPEGRWWCSVDAGGLFELGGRCPA